jgi:hypothetical protein
MDKHPDKVEKYNGTLQELAHDIVKMRYDKVTEFLTYFRDELIKEYESDKQKGRVKLYSALEETINTMDLAKNQMDKIWKICKPYMKL